MGIEMCSHKTRNRKASARFELHSYAQQAGHCLLVMVMECLQDAAQWAASYAPLVRFPMRSFFGLLRSRRASSEIVFPRFGVANDHEHICREIC